MGEPTMTQKPTKNEKMGVMDMVPYPVAVFGIKLMQALSLFPQPITFGIIKLLGVPFYLIRAIKRSMMKR
jgi:hypothetical protein